MNANLGARHWVAYIALVLTFTGFGYILGRTDSDHAGSTIVTRLNAPPYQLCYADGKQWATMIGKACRIENAPK